MTTYSSTTILKISFRAAVLAALLTVFVSPERISAQQWTTNGNDISNANSGNVGVGLTVPLYKFDVLSSSANIARFSSNAAAHSGVLFNAASGYDINLTLQNGGVSKWFFGNRASNDRFSFINAGGSTEVFTILQNGNVGVGTSAPSVLFHVAGNAMIGTMNAANGTYRLRVAGMGTGSYKGIGIYADDTTQTGGLPINGLIAIDLCQANVACIKSANNLGSIPLVLQDGGGNVGIGTTSPSGPLHVSTGAVVSEILRVESTTNSSNVVVGLKDSSPGQTRALGMNFINSSGLAQGQIAFFNDPTQANQYMRFNTAGAERMRIDGSGKVGIGTTPTYKLDVAGQIRSSSGGFIFPDGTVQTTAASGGGAVSSVFGRTGAVVAAAYDYTWAQINKSTSSLGDIATRNAGDLNSGTLPIARLGSSGTAGSTTFLRGDNMWAVPAGAVSSVFGRTGAVVAAPNDYTWAQINKSTSSLHDIQIRSASDLNAGTLPTAQMPALSGDVSTVQGNVVTTLATTGVTAASYTNANITVDAKGRITAASNGTTGSTAFSDITAGTNVRALVVGNGGSLSVSGTGTVAATSLSSNAPLNASSLTSGTVPLARLGTGTADSTKFLRGDNTWATSSQWATNGANISYTSGSVGIGTTTPDTLYKLDVVGDVRVSGNIAAKYQDVAEWVPASEKLAAGTVVVLDTTKSNQVTSSNAGYDTRVAGVISEQPGIALGESGNGKVLVATTGRVKVKVDASKGPINIGDLLVTSDIPGVAMKSEPLNLGGVQLHRPGTLIGKALEPLAKGSGEILVLLSLQ